MSRQRTQLLIRRRPLIILPQLHQIITPPRHQPPHRALSRRSLRTCQRTGLHTRRPRHRIRTQTMRREEHVRESVVVEGEHADVGVGGCGSEMTARFLWGPGDEVDGGGVEGEFVDALPGARLLAPDEDAAVVGGGGEDGAEFGVRPGDAPHGAFVADVISQYYLYFCVVVWRCLTL